MLVKSCNFNPACDITPVSDTGFVDLQTAFLNNAIPSQIAESDTDYNGIEDPASILGKPSDIFEAMDMEGYVKGASDTDGSKKDSASS